MNLPENYTLVTSGAGHPIRVVDDQNNVVVKVSKYTGIYRPLLMQIQNNNMNINNKYGGTPPVIVSVSPNYTYSMYEGFPWVNTSNDKVFAIATNLNLRVNADSNAYPLMEYYLNWVRTDSPADIIVQIAATPEPQYYAIATVQKEKEDGSGYDTIATGIKYALTLKAGHYVADYPLESIEAYAVSAVGDRITVAVSDTMVTSTITGYTLNLDATSYDQENKPTVTIKYDRDSAYYVLNDVTFGYSSITYDSPDEGSSKWNGKITLPSSFNYNDGNETKQKEILRWRVTKTVGEGYYIENTSNNNTPLFEYDVLKSDAINTEPNHFIIGNSDDDNYVKFVHIYVSEGDHKGTVYYKIKSDNSIYDVYGEKVSVKLYTKKTCTKETECLSPKDLVNGTQVYGENILIFTPLTSAEMVTVTFVTHNGVFDDGRQRESFTVTAGGRFADYYGIADGTQMIVDFVDNNEVHAHNDFIVLVNYGVELTGYSIVEVNGTGQGNVVVHTGATYGTIQGSWKVWGEGESYGPYEYNFATDASETYKGFVILVGQGVTLSRYTLVEIISTTAGNVETGVSPGAMAKDPSYVGVGNTWKLWNKSTYGSYKVQDPSDFGLYVFDGFYAGNIKFDLEDPYFKNVRLQTDMDFVARWIPNEALMNDFVYYQDGQRASITTLRDAASGSIVHDHVPQKMMPGTEISMSIQPESGYTIDVERTKGELGYSLTGTEIYMDVTLPNDLSGVPGNSFLSWKTWGTGTSVRKESTPVVSETSDKTKNGLLVYIAEWQQHGSGEFTVILAANSYTGPNLTYESAARSITLPAGNWKVWGQGSPYTTTYVVSAADSVDGFIVLVKDDVDISKDYTLIFASQFTTLGSGYYPTGLDHYYKDSNGSRFVKNEQETVYRYESLDWKPYKVTDVTGKDGSFVRQFSDGIGVVYKVTREGVSYRGGVVTYTVGDGGLGYKMIHSETPAETYYVDTHGVIYNSDKTAQVHKVFYSDIHLVNKIIGYSGFADTVYSADFIEQSEPVFGFYIKGPEATGTFYKDPACTEVHDPESDPPIAYTKEEYGVSNAIISMYMYVSEDTKYYALAAYGSEYECIETSFLYYGAGLLTGNQYRDIFGNIWTKNNETGEFEIYSVTVYYIDMDTNQEVSSVIKKAGGHIIYPAQPYYYKDQYGNHAVGNYLIDEKVSTLYLDKNGDKSVIETLTVKYAESNEYIKELYDGLTLKYYMKKNGALVNNDANKTPATGTLYHDSGCTKLYKGDYTITMVSTKYNALKEMRENGSTYYVDAFGNKYEDWLGTPTKLPGTRGYSWTYILKDDLDLTVYTKKVSYTINFIINGVKVSTTDVNNRVSTVPSLEYDQTGKTEYWGQDIPEYTIVAFDGPAGINNITWYTDPSYKEEYEMHNSAVQLEPDKFPVGVTLPDAPAVQGKTFNKWVLWGGSSGYTVKKFDAFNGFIVLVNGGNTGLRNYTVITVDSTGTSATVADNYSEGASAPSGTWKVWGKGDARNDYKISSEDAYNGFIVLVDSSNTTLTATTVISIDASAEHATIQSGSTIAGSWKVWGMRDYNEGADVERLYGPKSSGENYYYVFVADWQGVAHNEETYKVVFATSYGSVRINGDEKNLLYMDDDGRINLNNVTISDVTGLDFKGWKLWNTVKKTGEYTIDSGDAKDRYILFVADWGEDISKANNVVYASEYGEVKNMESIRKYQFLSDQNISLYAHAGTYILYIHDFYGVGEKTVKYELSPNESDCIVIPDSDTKFGNYVFVGWSAFEDSKGKRIYSYAPGEGIRASAMKDQTDLYPYYLSNGTATKLYDGKDITLELTLDDVLSEYQHKITRQNIQIRYADTEISSLTGGREHSGISGTHVGDYTVYYYAEIKTPKGEGSISYVSQDSFGEAIPGDWKVWGTATEGPYTVSTVDMWPSSTPKNFIVLVDKPYTSLKDTTVIMINGANDISYISQSSFIDPIPGDWKVWGNRSESPYVVVDGDKHNGFIVLVDSSYLSSLHNTTVIKIVAEESYGNTMTEYGFKGEAELVINPIDAYAIAPSRNIREGDAAGITVTDGDIITIGMVSGDCKVNLSSEAGYGNTITTPGVVKTGVIFSWTGYIALVEPDISFTGYTVILVGGVNDVKTSTELAQGAPVTLGAGNWKLWGTGRTVTGSYSVDGPDATTSGVIILIKEDLIAGGYTVIKVDTLNSGSAIKGLSLGDTISNVNGYKKWGGETPVSETYTIIIEDAEGYMFDAAQSDPTKKNYQVDYNLRNVDGALVIYAEDTSKNEHGGYI